MNRPLQPTRVRPYRLPLATAHQQWADGKHLEAAKLIFEAMIPADRVAWVAGILQFCEDRCGPLPEVAALLNIAHNPENWHQAKEQILHRASLRSSPAPAFAGSVEVRERLSEVAYLATKVVYNASGQPAPYDHNAGWKVGPAFFNVLASLGEPVAMQSGATTILRNPRRHAA